MGDRIADLILARGNAQARGLSARGAIWGDTLSNLGQIGAGVTGQVMEGIEVNRAEQAAARESQALRQLFSAGSPTPEQLIGVVGPERGIRIATGLQALKPTTDPVKDYTARQTILRDTILGMHALPEDMRAEQWPHARQNLIDRKLLSEQDAPATYDKAFFDRLTNYGKEPEKPAKVGTREIDVRNPDGSVTKQIVADTPGQSFTSAAPAPTPAKAGSEEDFIARFAKDLGKPVEALTAPQIAAARRQYARQTRFTEGGTGGAAQEWVIRNGQPTPIPKGTAQPGDRPYDAVTARQQGAAGAGQSPYTAERSARVIGAIDDLDKRISPFTVGYGSLLARLPETEARAFQGKVNSLKANIAFNELTQMREASRTGGALGQVAVRELELLEAALGSLDAKQSGPQFREVLKGIKETVQRWNAATAVGDGPGMGAAPPAGGTPPAPAGWRYVPKPGGGWTAVPE